MTLTIDPGAQVPRYTETVRDLNAQPIILREVLERFASSTDIPGTSVDGIRSTVITATRFLLRTPQGLASRDTALDADIREFVPILHNAAKEYAAQHGHAAPGEHAARASRFVEWLTGGRRFDKRTRVDWPCPDAFLPIALASDKPNAHGEMGFLARCCRMLGYQDAPRVLPSWSELLSIAPSVVLDSDSRDSDGMVKKRIQVAMSTYRRARLLLLERTSAAERDEIESRYAVLSLGPMGRNPRHLGVQPAVNELLREAGRSPEAMSNIEKLQGMNANLFEDWSWWATSGEGAAESAALRDQCLSAILRVGGWAAAAGLLNDFRRADGLDDLFAIGISTTTTESLNPRLSRRLGTSSWQSLTVSLLEFLAEFGALESLRNSPITDGEPRNAQGKPYFTEAVWQTCSRIWTMTNAIYGKASGHGGDIEKKWALVQARWGRLQHELSNRQIPAEIRTGVKDKRLMIRTVTLPQLVCLGFPARRREVHRLRDAWLTARNTAKEKDRDPDLHPAVLSAYRRYFDAAVPFMVLCLATDDGLRLKQYARGSLGTTGNFRVTLRRDADGRPIGIASLSTSWTGNKSDPAHLKITERDGKTDTREGRDVRPGYVDMEIMWDVISVWRPRQLVSAGLVQSVATYDLEADLQSGRWALFPSNAKVPRPENSRTDISLLAGRELHYIVRAFLRPDLPDWENLTGKWRALWSIHILRLLTASYWGGIRDNWKVATFLTRDTEQTLREAYSEIDEALNDKLGLDTTDWRQPWAFDPWMDRLYHKREVIDLLAEPSLPVPRHLAELAQSWREAAPPLQQPRIRRRRSQNSVT